MPQTVQPVGSRTAPVLIVGEAPGKNEEEKGVPFIGTSGKELDKMLAQVGIDRRADCRLTNVFKTRPPGNNVEHFMPARKGEAEKKGAAEIRGRWVTPEGQEHLAAFREEISECRPRVVIALGNAALWALTGEWSVSKWRGSLLWSEELQCRVIPTYHPAAILRQWIWRPLAITDLRRAAREKKMEGPREPDWQFLLRPSFEEARAALGALLARADRIGADHSGTHAQTGPGRYYPPSPCFSSRIRPHTPPRLHLSVDLETRLNHIACIGIADSASSALCIPFMCVERAEGYFTEEEEFELVKLIRQLLTHPSVVISGQNYLYDAQFTARWWGVVGQVAMDTMVAHHVLFAGDIPKGLDTLSSLYCEWHQYWKDEGKNWDPAIHDEDTYWRYNCLDACRTWEIAEVLSSTLPEVGLEHTFEMQMWQFLPVLRMMLRGVRIDKTAKNNLMMELLEGKAERQQWLNEVLEREININSPKQMQELFYAELGCKVVKNRKSGNPTADDSALQKIAARDPVLAPLCYTVQEMRTLDKLASLAGVGTDEDGRWRSSFNIAGTETYRWSSSKNAFGGGANFQNITKGEKQKGGGRFTLPNLRRLIVPDPGFEIGDVDLDRADVQIVAWDAGDEALKEKLRDRSRDLHTSNAADIFHVRYEDVTKFQRAFAKAFCHATNYGASARTLAINLGQPVKEMERAQAGWFSAHPGIAEWHERVEEELHSHRYVTNAFGYRRLYLDRVEGLLPEALAWIPQSSVAIIINIALCRMEEDYGSFIQPLIQVHDSLVFQYHYTMRERAIAAARQCLEVRVPYPDPLTIPVGFEISRESWGSVEALGG